jgi:hypothetical protein
MYFKILKYEKFISSSNRDIKLGWTRTDSELPMELAYIHRYMGDIYTIDIRSYVLSRYKGVGISFKTMSVSANREIKGITFLITLGFQNR